MCYYLKKLIHLLNYKSHVQRNSLQATVVFVLCFVLTTELAALVAYCYAHCYLHSDTLPQEQLVCMFIIPILQVRLENLLKLNALVSTSANWQ